MKLTITPRIIIIALVVLLSMVFIMWFFQNYLLRSRASGANASINLISTVSVGVNEEFDAPITLNTDGAEVISADLVISFDKNALQVVDITPRSELTSVFTLFPQNGSGVFNKGLVISNGNSSGKIQIGAISHPEQPSPPGFAGNAIVGVIKFKALQNGSSTVSVVFNGAGATNDSNLILKGGGDILNSVTNMTVTVGSSTTPVPSTIRISSILSPTPTPVSIICTTKSQGDSDCNGVVNSSDFVIWKNEFLGATVTKTSDFNGDGRINLIDYEIWRNSFR